MTRTSTELRNNVHIFFLVIAIFINGQLIISKIKFHNIIDNKV